MYFVKPKARWSNLEISDVCDMALVFGSLSLCAAWQVPQPQPQLSRRVVLQQGAFTAAAFAAAPLPAFADLGDLDGGPAEAMPSYTRTAPTPLTEGQTGEALTMVTLEPGQKKKKKDTPAERIKELKAKGGLTDKEKKELRRLQQEEMCDLLGRGC